MRRVSGFPSCCSHCRSRGNRKSFGPLPPCLLFHLRPGFECCSRSKPRPVQARERQAAVTWHSYLLIQGEVILRYFRMLLLPWGFTVDADFPVRAVWLGVLAWLAVLGLAFFAWRTRNRSQAGIWFLGGLVLLLPSSSIFPANDLAADYRMYLPMIGFAGCHRHFAAARATDLPCGRVPRADVSEFCSHPHLADRAIFVGRCG